MSQARLYLELLNQVYARAGMSMPDVSRKLALPATSNRYFYGRMGKTAGFVLWYWIAFKISYKHLLWNSEKKKA